MKHYSEAAVERMMKVQEVIVRALAASLPGERRGNASTHRSETGRADRLC